MGTCGQAPVLDRAVLCRQDGGAVAGVHRDRDAIDLLLDDLQTRRMQGWLIQRHWVRGNELVDLPAQHNEITSTMARNFVMHANT